MGLLDKIKNLFLEDEMEEEELELEEENKNMYQEPKDVLPKVMRDTIKQEEETIKFADLKPLKESRVNTEEVKKTEDVLPQRKFSFPIEFEEEVSTHKVEVAPSRVNNNINKNVLNVQKEIKVKEHKEVQTQRKVSELYSKKDVVEKPKFKPTPVISPVYGILDKNYTKEEVREKAEENVEMKRPSKSVDFETVRKKAFGNLTDEIKDNLMCENCELYKEAKRISAISSDDLLYDMMVDDEIKVSEPVTLEKAYDNYEDFGVAYEPHRETPKVENNTTIINNTEVHISEKIEIEEKVSEDKKDAILSSNENLDVPEVKIPSREEKNKETKVDDDFFELIDSMYKERIDG